MRSFILSRLEASAAASVSQGCAAMIEGLTKEAKVSGMNDSRCIRLSREVIECRKSATDVGNTEEPAMGCVEYFCLGIDLMLRLRVGRVCLAGGGGGRAREGLHFGGRRWGEGGGGGAAACSAFVHQNLPRLSSFGNDNPFRAFPPIISPKFQVSKAHWSYPGRILPPRE